MRTVEAASTRIFSLKNNAPIMKAPVTRMETCGVLNLALTRLRNSGSKPSLLNASGYLAAAIIPAFAVEMNASIAATLKTILPHDPMKTAPPSDSCPTCRR